MEAWTLAELRAFAPRGKDEYLQAFVDGEPDMLRASINTPLRKCWFIAQWYEETGGFANEWVENTNWSLANCTANWPDHFGPKAKNRLINIARFKACRNAEDKANLIYGSLVDCGNEEATDGYLFRGRGFNQVTARKNYKRYGDKLGIDLENNPALAENPAISLKIAVLEWTENDCNRFADRNNGRAIGNAINRGNPYSSAEPIGAKERQDAFDKAWSLWGDDKPRTSGLDKGDHGTQVELLQRKLSELGYAVGKPDGVYGPVLARAVVSFKHDYQESHADAQLEPGSLVDSATWAAIDDAAPVKHSDERENATEDDLAEAGSTTINQGKMAKRLGKVLTAGGAVGGAHHTGALDAATDAVSGATAKVEVITRAQHAFEPLILSLKWLAAHALWIAPLGIGIAVYAIGTKTIAAYVTKFRAGHILWR